MAKKIGYIIVGLIICTNIFSQNRAPSCWLKYNDNFKGDIIINSVRVISPSPLYTYYCTLQWNAGQEAGGYCGIQEHPDGRNFIFSIWDPKASNEPISAAFKHPNTKVENFGGEGTGLKSWNFGIGWETENWYSFCARAWDDNSHTMFGYWVYDRSNTIWHHLVTMDFPIKGIRFNTGTGSFIEDWLGNGQNKREVHQAEGWKRSSIDSSWHAFNSAKFERVSPDNGAANYINNYDGGLISGYYFMKSGAPTSPETNTSGTTLEKQNAYTSPNYKKGEIKDLNNTINDDKLTVTWTIDSSCTPQFKFHFEIFLNPEYNGNAAIKRNIQTPHARSYEYDLSSLPNNRQYYYRIYITDIFDHRSEYQTGSFTNGELTDIVSPKELQKISISPNPTSDYIELSNINWVPITVNLYNLSGKNILSEKIRQASNTKIQLQNIQSGFYVLELLSKTESRAIKLLIN